MAEQVERKPGGGSGRQRRYVVGRVGEVPAGGRKLVEVAGRSIGIFNVDGRFFAVRNRCPHQGGQLCLGVTTGLATSDGPGDYELEREGEILRCPWHGWEFDLTDGRSVVDPQGVRVRSYEVEMRAETYPVEVEERELVLVLSR